MIRRTRCSSSILFLLYIVFPSAVNLERVTSSEEEQQPLPRGIYHFSDTDRDIETSFKIPNFEALDPIRVASDLMSSAMKVDTKRKTLAGIQMPFSLTGRPMSLQINGESHDAVSLVDDPKKRENKEEKVRRSDMSPESRRAFLHARQVCLEQSSDSCDEALDTFHRVRFGKSLLVSEDQEDEGGEENGNLERIIERRLKEVTEPSTTHRQEEEEEESNLFSTSSESLESELPRHHPLSESSIKNRFSHIKLPKYHDKAHHFLRDINN